MAARCALLALALLLLLAAMGAVGAGAEALQPSAQRLAVTAVLALLSLLFWPGAAHSLRGTARRVLAWSVGVAVLAAVTLQLAGQPLQTWNKVFSSCALLCLMLVVAHTLAAALELRMRARGADADAARESAGSNVAWALALLGALPLWAGPLAEVVSGRHEWLIDALIAASPLTHLAVASENDLLRNQWLYQHANLAALPVLYPELHAVLAAYAAAGLALLALALARRRRTGAEAEFIDPKTELTP